MEAFPSTFIRREVNYLPVVCSPQPLQNPTLLLYLNPSVDLTSLNVATLRKAADYIAAGTEERNCILMKDFNTPIRYS